MARPNRIERQIADRGVSEPLRSRYPDFAGLLAAGEDEGMSTRLRKAETIGRPVGDTAFLQRLEQISGRALTPQKPGPKPRQLSGVSVRQRS